jgi:hypothetical protein
MPVCIIDTQSEKKTCKANNIHVINSDFSEEYLIQQQQERKRQILKYKITENNLTQNKRFSNTMTNSNISRNYNKNNNGILTHVTDQISRGNFIVGGIYEYNNYNIKIFNGNVSISRINLNNCNLNIDLPLISTSAYIPSN